ncbi:hypothetical protein MNV_810027 [Candidatus Methanoperedens nitroreducens]|uniref:Uncharacterized protein n=1 Tax=Candidatus Methanoperedens nitratireducens TaxID=1392998 RepID=A0A284VTR0_9EURY|nr:hypothetical protein MNV_810027 [Candidatus Methanoperedens nitroreducens]
MDTTPAPVFSPVFAEAHAYGTPPLDDKEPGEEPPVQGDNDDTQAGDHEFPGYPYRPLYRHRGF